MLVTFDSNNLKINNYFEKKQPIIQSKLWCECKINEDYTEYCCDDLSKSTFEFGKYLYFQTPISYMSTINNLFPNNDKNVHIICLDFSEGLFDDEDKIFTQNILNNINQLEGYVIIITNNYEKVYNSLKKQYMTYVYLKKNFSEKLIYNFTSMLIHFIFVLEKMFLPEDLIQLWRDPNFKDFKPLQKTMFVNLEDFSIHSEKNNKLKPNCSLNK